MEQLPPIPHPLPYLPLLLIVPLSYRYGRLFKTVEEIPRQYFHKHRKIRGRIISVGDGDNFRMVHVPLLRPWRWFIFSPSKQNTLSASTLHIRLAGVDAPECPHFGKAGQPYGEAALAWLRRYLSGRRVTVQLESKDQYGRAVSSAWIRGGVFPVPMMRRNVSMELLRSGYGVVYEGGQAVYGAAGKKRLMQMQSTAQRKRRGMWRSGRQDQETPMAFKARTKN
eukprot:gb/GECH01003305.1/.p1 GENE.gb/GECH01003305.1/~~gb/GECH01003305.1/.p1  ORF type:complete len:224 (+),score=50.11 gb/GECH01003305.1/:1-672(+)